MNFIKLKNYLIESISYIFAVLFIILCIISWQIISIINNPQEISKTIESLINDKQSNVKVKFQSSKLNFGGLYQPLIVDVHGLELSFAEEEIKFENSSINISIINLLRGKIKLNSLKFSDFIFNIDSNKINDIGNFNNILYLTEFNKFISNIDLTELEYEFNNGTINFSFDNKKIILDNFSLKFSEKINNKYFYGFFNLNESEKIFFKKNNSNSFTQIDFNISKLDTRKNLYFLDELQNLFEGELSGDISIEFNKKFELQNIHGELTKENVIINSEILKSYIRENIFHGNFSFNYDLVKDKFDIRNLNINNNNNSFYGSILVDGLFKKSKLISTHLESKKINLKSFKIYNFLNLDNENIKFDFNEGKINEFKVSLQLTAKENFDNFKLNNLDSKAFFESLYFNYNSEYFEKIRGNFGGEISLAFNDKNNNLSSNGLLMFDQIRLMRDKTENQETLKSFKLNWEQNPKFININNIELLKDKNTKIGGKIEIKLDDYSISKLSLDLNSSRIQYNLLKKLWPKKIRKAILSWMNINLKDGYAENVNLKADFINVRKELKNSNFLLSWLNKSSTFRIFKDLPEANLNEALCQLTNNKLIVDIINLKIDEIIINEGQIIVDNILTKNTEASMKINFKEESKKILMKFDSPDLSLFKISNKDVEGIFNVEATLNVPILSGISIDNLKWKIDAIGKNIKFNISKYGLNIFNELIKVEANNNEFVIKSMSNINNDIFVNQKFEWIYKRILDNKPQILINFLKSASLINFIKQNYSIPIEGTSEGIIQVGEFDINNITANTILNLNIDLILSQFGLNIPLKVGNIVNFDIDIIDSKLKKIKNISANINDIMIFAEILFNNNGEIKKFIINNLALENLEIEKLILTRENETNILIEIDSSNLDLRKFFKNKFWSNEDDFWLLSNKNIKFIINSDNIILENGISLNGIIEASYNNKKLSGKVEGNLETLNQSINKIKLDIFQNMKEIVLKGNGYLLDEKIDINVISLNGSIKEIKVNSNNAGKVLNALNISELIFGGNLEAKIDLSNQHLNEINYDINIDNFKVINAPILVQIISTLSLRGILNLLEEGGILFSNGSAKITYKDGIEYLNSINAIGDTLALSFSGLINRNNETIEIQGQLVPANTINNILKNIPILGELLTGTDFRGFILTEFRLDGLITDPIISFRPLSSAPGIFRDFLNIFRSDLDIKLN